MKRFSNNVTSYQAEVNKVASGNQAQIQEWTSENSQFTAYAQEASKYYQWATSEVQAFIQNNSKVIKASMAMRASQQQAGAQ